MTAPSGAEPGERTDDWQDYRNGSYQRKLTTRVGRLELEVPRDQEGKDGAFSAVSAVGEGADSGPNADGSTGSLHAPREGDHHRTLRARTQQVVAPRLIGELNEQVEAWASRSLEESSYPFLLLYAMHLKVRRQGAVRSTTAGAGGGHQ